MKYWQRDSGFIFQQSREIFIVVAGATAFLIKWPERDVLRLTMPLSF